MRTGACTHGPDCDCDVIDCSDCAALREENARLKQQVNLLTVRRDQLSAEVKRLEGLILDSSTKVCIIDTEILSEAARIRGEKPPYIDGEIDHFSVWKAGIEYREENARLREQLRLSTIDAANEMARANDAEAELERCKEAFIKQGDLLALAQRRK